jgi:hypothetical protein
MCDYEAEYYDYEKGDWVLYECPHEPSQPRCMFHDGSSYKSRPDDVRKAFYKMVEDAIQNDQPLYCIGFRLPYITVRGKEFVKPVYFSGAKFQQQANFFRTTFQQQANFLYATFQQQVDFSYATFQQQADFSYANFIGEVEFNNTTFSNENMVNKYLFSWDDHEKKIIKALNEIIPTDCGWLYNVNLKVEGTEITASKPPHELSIKLNDDKPDKAESARLIVDGLIYELIVRRKNNKLHLYTGIPIIFDYSTFRSRVRFIGDSNKPLDLSNVSFKGVNLDNVEFHNVKWREDKVLWFLPFIKRNIVADELFMDELKNYQEVSRIYNQLRKNYEMHLHFTEASHFFIGEMEAIRRSLWSKGIGDKLASIPYLLYKWIALYGESVFLPLVFWTPVIIIGFAVWRILVSNCYDPQCMIDRVIDSIAAYFQVPRNALQPTVQDIIERILAVPILGSAFIALRRRFERRK